MNGLISHKVVEFCRWRMIWLVELILFCFMTACPSMAESPVPVVWWKMDSVSADGSVTDATGGGNHLQIGSGCSLANDWLLGSVMTYNGCKEAWGRALNATQFTGSRTVSLWLCRAADDGPMDPAVNKIPYVFNGVSGTMLAYNRGSLTYSIGPTSASSFSAIDHKKRLRWMHIVVVVEYDADDQTYPWKLRAYSDGVQCYSNSKPEYKGEVAVAGVNSGNIVIGNLSMEGNRPFCGMISDVRVYDTVLSAQEVTTIYNEKVANWNNYVVGCWNMDEIEEKEGNRVVKPVVPSQVDLVAGTSVELSADAISGLSACFPNLNTSSLYFELPYAMKEISFGVYVNVSTNLMALEKEANNNKVPHVFNFPSFSRMCIQNEFRELKSNGAKVFDVATLDNANDQGFNCSYITHQKGRWSHLGVTYEMRYDENAGQFGVQPRIYVDGELVTTGRWQTASTLTGVFPKGTTFILGNMGVGSARPFGGLMDDFFFYSGRLSDSQMKDLSGGLPSVSAGANFTVAAATARVCGELGLTGVLSNRAPCAVSSQWSVVSTPKGGEAAMIESPANICSTVSLPVEGEYVLRLTIKDLLGREKTSDVAVTRVPSPADNVSPAISVRGDASAQVGIPTELYADASDPDKAPGNVRVSWKMLSGPGAVRFEPAQGVSTKATFFVDGEYRIVAVATDGATEVVSAAHTVTVEIGDAIDLANGLIGYWPFDGSKEDKITKAAYTANGSASFMGSVVTMEPGVDKAAIRCHGAFYPYFDTSRDLQEEEDPDLSTTPKERYRAFSCWIYHDSSDTNNSSHATIVDVPYTLGLWYKLCLFR